MWLWGKPDSSKNKPVQRQIAIRTRDDQSESSVSNNGYSRSPFSRSPNGSLKLGQLPVSTVPKRTASSLINFPTPKGSRLWTNYGRYCRIQKRDRDRNGNGTVFVKLAPVDLKGAGPSMSPMSPSGCTTPNALDFSTMGDSSNSNHTSGLGGIPQSGLANRFSRLWPNSLQHNRSNATTTNNLSTPGSSSGPNNILDALSNRKRARELDLSSSETNKILRPPSTSTPLMSPDDANKHSKRVKYLTDQDMRLNRPLAFEPYQDVRSLQNESPFTSKSILEQMNQTEKRFFPDSSPITSASKRSKLIGSPRGSSTPIVRKRKGENGFSMVEYDDDEVSHKDSSKIKTGKFCHCNECYAEAAGLSMSTSSPTKMNMSMLSNTSPIKKTVTFNDTSFACDKGTTTDMSTNKSEIIIHKASNCSAYITKEKYDDDKAKRLERFRRILGLKQSEPSGSKTVDTVDRPSVVSVSSTPTTQIVFTSPTKVSSVVGPSVLSVSSASNALSGLPPPTNVDTVGGPSVSSASIVNFGFPTTTKADTTVDGTSVSAPSTVQIGLQLPTKFDTAVDGPSMLSVSSASTANFGFTTPTKVDTSVGGPSVSSASTANFGLSLPTKVDTSVGEPSVSSASTANFGFTTPAKVDTTTVDGTPVSAPSTFQIGLPAPKNVDTTVEGASLASNSTAKLEFTPPTTTTVLTLKTEAPSIISVSGNGSSILNNVKPSTGTWPSKDEVKPPTNSTTTSIFGTVTPSPVPVFGASSGTQSQPTTTGGFSFGQGQQQSTSTTPASQPFAFGQSQQQPSTTTVSTAPSSFAFGQSTNAQSHQGGFSFSSPTQQTQPQPTNTFGVFGAASAPQSGSGTFTSIKPSTGAWPSKEETKPTTSANTSIFGTATQSTAPVFGASSVTQSQPSPGGFSFGQGQQQQATTPASQPFAFGQSQQQSTTSAPSSFAFGQPANSQPHQGLSDSKSVSSTSNVQVGFTPSTNALTLKTTAPSIISFGGNGSGILNNIKPSTGAWPSKDEVKPTNSANTSIFGSLTPNPAPVFGTSSVTQSQPSPGGFSFGQGQQQSTTPASQPFAFGQSQQQQTTTPASSSFAFGQPANSQPHQGGFNFSSPTQQTQSQPANTFGVFGTASAPQSGSGMFNSIKPSTGAWPSKEETKPTNSANTSIFGTVTQSPASVFGGGSATQSQPSTGGFSFGQGQQQQQSITSTSQPFAFGQSQQQQSTTPASNSFAFGQPGNAQPNQGGFNFSAQAQQQPANPFGTSTPAPAQPGMFNLGQSAAVPRRRAQRRYR